MNENVLSLLLLNGKFGETDTKVSSKVRDRHKTLKQSDHRSPEGDHISKRQLGVKSW